MVEKLFQNMVRANIAQRAEDETDRDFERRLTAAIAKRWDVSLVTLRSWRNGNRRPGSGRRQFFADLRKFGALKFGPDGKPIKATANKGPGMEEFIGGTSSGYKPELYRGRNGARDAKPGNGKTPARATRAKAASRRRAAKMAPPSARAAR